MSTHEEKGIDTAALAADIEGTAAAIVAADPEHLQRRDLVGRPVKRTLDGEVSETASASKVDCDLDDVTISWGRVSLMLPTWLVHVLQRHATSTNQNVATIVRRALVNELKHDIDHALRIPPHTMAR